MGTATNFAAYFGATLFGAPLRKEFRRKLIDFMTFLPGCSLMFLRVFIGLRRHHALNSNSIGTSTHDSTASVPRFAGTNRQRLTAASAASSRREEPLLR